MALKTIVCEDPPQVRVVGEKYTIHVPYLNVKDKQQSIVIITGFHYIDYDQGSFFGGEGGEGEGSVCFHPRPLPMAIGSPYILYRIAPCCYVFASS